MSLLLSDDVRNPYVALALDVLVPSSDGNLPFGLWPFHSLEMLENAAETRTYFQEIHSLSLTI